MPKKILLTLEAVAGRVGARPDDLLALLDRALLRPAAVLSDGRPLFDRDRIPDVRAVVFAARLDRIARDLWLPKAGTRPPGDLTGPAP